MIDSISVSHFRILSKVDIDFSSAINIFYGLNGSGKTSLLESIFFISRGKSFKQYISSKLIHFNSSKFIIYCVSNTINHIGIQKSHHGKLLIKYNNKFIYSSFFLSKLNVIQILNPDSYLLIDSGPAIRRNFMDWMVFHVKHHLHDQWKRYKCIIKNRNSALKNKLSKSEIRIWDNELTSISLLLSKHRKYYINLLNDKLKLYKENYLFNFDIELDYYPGWNSKMDYKTILLNNFDYDLKCGYTKYGIHKSEFIIKLCIDGKKYFVKDFLSNGQKKYLAMFLYILQIVIFKNEVNTGTVKPVLLIDDITSELDIEHSSLLLEFIAKIDLQIFFTILETTENKKFISSYVSQLFSDNKDQKVKLFHVKQGEIIEQLNYTEF